MCLCFTRWIYSYCLGDKHFYDFQQILYYSFEHSNAYISYSYTPKQLQISMIKQYDHLFKIVIVGSQGVGKSAIFLRFSDNSYFQNYTATIGVDFKFRTLQVDHTQCKLQIWDTAGQQRFKTITSAYYRGSHAIVIVYDLSNSESFHQVENYWLNEIKSNASPDVLIAFMGSKVDLQRNVQSQTIKNLAASIGVKSYEVSAKLGDGVMQAFQDICRDLIRLNMAKKNTKIKGESLGDTQLKDKKRCC